MTRRRPVKREEAPASPSLRWSTTLTSDMDRVAKELVGSSYYDTASRLDTLTKRKLANTKTSISFGNEKVVYVSDAMETQLAGGMPATPAERAAQLARIKGMKAALTLTNFSLGDEAPVYSSVNRDAMALSNNFSGAGRVKMNQEVMDAVKRSSITFGNEAIRYKSVAHEAMEFQGGGGSNEKDFQKLKEDTVALTAALRKHNFSFGEEVIEYVSDQTRGYGSVPLGAYRQRLGKLQYLASLCLFIFSHKLIFLCPPFRKNPHPRRCPAQDQGDNPGLQELPLLTGPRQGAVREHPARGPA